MCARALVHAPLFFQKKSEERAASSSNSSAKTETARARDRGGAAAADIREISLSSPSLLLSQRERLFVERVTIVSHTHTRVFTRSTAQRGYPTSIPHNAYACAKKEVDMPALSREREKEFLSPPPDWALIWLLRFPQFKKFLYLYNIYRVYIIFCVIFLNVAFFLAYVNDPSAGSPTETLLRLLLPLNDQVWSSSRHNRQRKITLPRTSPKTSLNHSIGSSDGRCVQRAGT